MSRVCSWALMQWATVMGSSQEQGFKRQLVNDCKTQRPLATCYVLQTEDLKASAIPELYFYLNPNQDKYLQVNVYCWLLWQASVMKEGLFCCKVNLGLPPTKHATSMSRHWCQKGLTLSYLDVLTLKLALLGQYASDKDILHVDQRRLQGSLHEAVGHPGRKDVPEWQVLSKLSSTAQ